MTTYYTVSGVPTAHSFGSSAYMRAEYTLIQTAFATVNTEMVTKGAIAGQAWTGSHTFPTQTQGDNSTKAATTAYADTIKTYGTATYAPLAGATYTGAHDFTAGTTTVATQSAGDATTKAASTAFVSATAFSAALPGQTGNAGKYVTTNGTTASWQMPPAIATFNQTNYGGL